MAGVAEVMEFVEEIAFLESVFGGTVSSSVIATVLESCGGNVHLAADVIVNFSNEMSSPSQKAPESIVEQVTPVLNVDAPPFEFQQTTMHQPSTANQQSAALQVSTTEKQLPSPSSARQQPTILNQPLSVDLSTVEAHSVSFSEAFRNSGALPKKPPDSKTPKPRYKNVWNDQVGKILHYHNEGTRILIIMRGVSGSGKSYLAKHIVDYTIGPSSQNYSRHIFSSDDYFMRKGVYQYNRDSLKEAHIMNQRKVCEATNKGVSPILVDNTNTELWEMEPYIQDGVRNGYMIEFVEPNTPWFRNASQLEKRNTHGVPRENIRRMLDRYDNGITPDSAMKSLGIKYSPNKKPPIERNIPPFPLPGSPRESPKRENDKDQASNASAVEITRDETPNVLGEPNNIINIAVNNVAESKKSPDNVDGKIGDEHDMKLKKIVEVQKQIEEFEKVEQEWENGASWESGTKDGNAQNIDQASEIIDSGPKPPRRTEKKNIEKLQEPNDYDWTKYMLPWQDSSVTIPNTIVETPVQVETKSIGTGFEVNDVNEHMHTVLYAISRDINEGIIVDSNKPKMPKVIFLDKSTSTHDNDFLTKKEVCKNKEHHFRELRRMFKSVPRDSLRDIFESCNFDVNWAVDLVLDSHTVSQDNVNNNITISDDEESFTEECNCLAGYNIVPDTATHSSVSPVPENLPPTPTHLTQKKPKRENKLSDNSLSLKRQIESNVMISDNHYSQHYLNLRRRREYNFDGPDRASASVSNDANTENTAQNNVSGLDIDGNATQNSYISTNFRDVAGPSNAHYNLQFMDSDNDSDTESDSNKSDHLETSVTINLGPEFLGKLDELFGRKNFVYPENIQPAVNLPMSILQQINAHWAMSVAAQLDDLSMQSEAMIKQDEDFARQLADREHNMSDEGKEPEVPSLAEIMDMELAYTLYERSVAEWRNNEPQNWAAKLSREKLFKLFPDMSQEVLSEILMAHEYNFKATVESLMISTGQSSWLEDEKGIEKFVLDKEMKRKEEFIIDAKKNLAEAEGNTDRPVTLDTVNFYRAEAEKALKYRNLNFDKAKKYFLGNSPDAAAFYSDIASLHTRKYEHYNARAANYLMKYHLMMNPDHDILDLHFMRVAEAIVNIDIFLDAMIRKLRNENIASKDTWIITGKGLHSVGGPRIKPAARKRLLSRGIKIKQINGGLFMAKLHPSHKMTSELKSDS